MPSSGGGINVFIGSKWATIVAITTVVAAAVVVPVVTGGGGGGGTFPNTTGANVFIAATGSDAGANCKRFSTAQTTPPTASTVCHLAAKAYELMQNGDTAWVLPGSYGTTHAFDFESNTPASFHTSVGTDCHATHECFYFIPQPGQEANVLFPSSDDDGNTVPGFKQNRTPDNLYYANFEGPHACPSFSATSATNGQTTGFAQDITVDNLTGTDCTYYMVGPWSFIRVLNSDDQYNCTNASVQAGGSVFPASNDPSGSDGQATNHIYAPHDILLQGNYIHDYVINGCGPAQPHQDCFHPRSGYNITFRNNVFNNCYDSSILWEGLQENGFNENNVIEGNWFGPTQCCGNNCCLRGASPGAENTEVFDGYTIRFNTSVGPINNKAVNVANGVVYYGNISTAGSSCAGSGSPGQIWSYNVFGDSGCTTGGTGNLISQSAGNIGLVSTSVGSLDLHVGSGSVALGLVPGSLTGQCAAASPDQDGTVRTAPCDAGADER